MKMMKLKKLPISFAQIWKVQKSTFSGALQKKVDMAASEGWSPYPPLGKMTKAGLLSS
jgi:hypothetical protein